MMGRHFRHWRCDAGQALIQVTLTLMVLLAFVALAIDVGRVYAERRNMQNAADAAALAGARELCLGRTTAEAEAKAAAVMRDNGVATAAISDDDITFEGSPDPYIINTVARHPDLSPIVGQLVDWDVVDVSATASAACGAATSACGIWPIAVSNETWGEIQPHTGEACEERKIAIWHDDLKDADYDSKTPHCTIDGEPRADLCDCYQCPKDLIMLSTAGRGWLDFSSLVVTDPANPFQDECYSGSSGGGSNELKCQIRRNSAVRIAELPRCVDGLTGVRASTKVPIDKRVGHTVRVPLYTEMDCNKESPKPSYELSSFGCVSVVGWMKLSDSDAFNLSKHIEPKTAFSTLRVINKNEKVIVIKMDCDGCMTACGGTDGSNPGAGGLRAVSLIK